MLSEPTIIDFIENFFERVLDYSLLEDIRTHRLAFSATDFKLAYAAWRHDLGDLRDMNRDEKQVLWASSHSAIVSRRGDPAGTLRQIPPRQSSSEIRPYVLANQRHRPGSYASHSTWKEQSRWEAVDAIKHRLLYCHSVAIENPMAIWMSESSFINPTYDSALRGGYLGWPHNAPSMLVGWLSFLLELRPAIESGAILIIEEESRDLVMAFSPKEVGLDDDTADRLRRELGLESIFELTRAMKTLCVLVRRREFSRQAVNFELSDNGLKALFNRKFGTNQRAAGALRPDVDTALQTLLATDLPSLGQLSIQDLVAVRHDAEAFQTWRGHLHQVVDRFSSMDDYAEMTDADRGVALRERFSRELLDWKNSLRNDLSRSPSLSRRLGERAVGFTLGAVAGSLIAGPTAALAVALTAVFGQEVVRAAGEVLGEHVVEISRSQEAATRRRNRALSGLFVAFEE
jgi:hypothetical protein